MESRIECSEAMDGTSITIKPSKGEITVETSGNGNGSTSRTFDMGNFVHIRTEDTEQVFQLRIAKSDNGSNGNSENDNKETETEAVNDDVRVGIEPMVDSQKTGVSAQIEPGIVQAVLSFREVTAEEIREEISEFVFLTKNEIRIIVALISVREKELKRGELGITNVADSNIPKALTRLEDLDLICYENNRELIKPNLDKIAASYPWIYSKEIQEIVRTKSDFRLGNSVQKVLGLLHKFTDGLLRNEIIDGIGLTRGGFVRSETTMTGYDLIKVTDRNGEAIIIPNFSVSQIEESPATSEESVATETDLTQDTGQSEHDGSISCAGNNNPRTELGFVLSKIESISQRIKSPLEGSKGIPLSNISSQFKAGIRKGLTELLDEINEITSIEIFDESSNEVIRSWEPEDLQNIKFEKLYIRRFSGEQTEDDSDKQGEHNLIGSTVEGTVTGIEDYGAFVSFFFEGKKRTGLIHKSNIVKGFEDVNPSEFFEKDDEVKCIIIDKSDKGISLSTEDFQRDPWDDVSENYKVDDIIDGRIIELTALGARIEVEKHFHGLVLSLHPDENSLNDENIGKVISFKIISIDSNFRNMMLEVSSEDAKNEDHKDQKGSLDSDAKGGKQESNEGGQEEEIVTGVMPEEPREIIRFQKKEVEEEKPKDKEDIRKEIIQRAIDKSLGGPFQNLLNILADNHPSSMEIKELTEEATKKRSMTESSVKPYLNILIREDLVGKDRGKYKLSTERKKT